MYADERAVRREPHVRLDRIQTKPRRTDERRKGVLRRKRLASSMRDEERAVLFTRKPFKERAPAGWLILKTLGRVGDNAPYHFATITHRSACPQDTARKRRE